MTESAPPATDIDPELSVRVLALSRECAALGRTWDASQVQFLYDESEQLAERARVRAEHRDGNVRPIAGQRIARGFGQRLQLVQLVLARAQRAVDERTQVGRQ